MVILQDWFDEICKVDTPQARFLRLIHAKPEAYCRKRNWGFIPCDQSTMAVALDNSIIMDAHSEYATVELHGKKCFN